MPFDQATAQRAGRISALRRQALTADPTPVAAREGRLRRYRETVLAVMPELTEDEGELNRRAELLERAEMIRMSSKAVKARKLKKQLVALEAELDASKLEDAGRDGADLDR